MNHLGITLSVKPAAYRPGETLMGEISWDLTDTLPGLELRLCWATEGNYGGGQSPVVALRERLEIEGVAGQRPFRVELPQGPWSFKGKLFSVYWYVELAVDDDDYHRADFVLGPGGKAVEVVPETPR